MSSKAIATTIYLEPGQRRALFRLAKKRGLTFSQEIRNAIENHISIDEGIDPKELSMLAKEADAAIERTIKVMDEAIDYVAKITSGSKRSAKRRRK